MVKELSTYPFEKQTDPGGVPGSEGLDHVESREG